jgi:hypothetical protein
VRWSLDECDKYARSGCRKQAERATTWMGHVRLPTAGFALVRAFLPTTFSNAGEGFRICDGEYDFTPIWEEFKALTAKVICALLKKVLA